ncbi:hypothetical protein P7K49_009870 [Saguinus oedipus]|uniref:Uncharacterized protein n=1 Tax=Saguinus oedipus TaxID=9490 RepID=A0ABQ9VML4_SAGOE|nr:hypothetical protein P7K49_009870 [Saguinus oedipus]
MPSAGTGCDREPWRLRASVHDSALRHTCSRPSTRAAPRDCSGSPRRPSRAVCPPQDPPGGRTGWPRPKLDRGFQRLWPDDDSNGARDGPSGTDLGPNSGPPRLAGSRCRLAGRRMSTSPTPGSCPRGARYGCPHRWGHPGLPGRLVPGPSSSRATTGSPAGPHHGPRERVSMATRGSRRGQPGSLPGQGPMRRLLQPQERL